MCIGGDRMKKVHVEEKVFRLSMIALLVFAVIAIVFGLALQSEVILFDGVFSIISISLSYMTLKITRFIRKKDPKRFPFGKEAIEPIIVFMQYFFLNVVLVYMFIDGIRMILGGGNDINLSMTILYIMITAIIQYVFLGYVEKIAKGSNSVIVQTELHMWQISMKQTFYVLGGYLIGVVLLVFNEPNIIVFIDPIILIVFIIVTFTQSVDEMLIAFKEVIGMTTVEKDMFIKIESKILEIRQKYDIKDDYIRLKKVGSMLVLEVDFLVDSKFKYGDVESQDEIREVLFKKVNDERFDLWLNVNFTTQMKWIE